MPASHPLDRPVWSALTGRQADVALIAGPARRLDPQFGLFAAIETASTEALISLGALIRLHGPVAVVEREAPPVVPDASPASSAVCWQMAATALRPGETPEVEMQPLGAADAPAMLALARRTRPGPFFARTPELGDFVGVKVDGRLVAMAGERMRLAGFTEVSGVCTHPDHRGRGYAAALMRHVAARILARGETPFLHAYASNTGAIRLYETLGFAFRRELIMTMLTPAGR